MKRRIIEAVVLVMCTLILEAQSKAVSINLKAKWNSTPFLAETSEYFFNKSSEAFWSFVDATTSLELNGEDSHEDVDYEKSVEIASKFLAPSKVKLLRFAHSIRYYSPAVQMHQEIAQDRSPPTNCKVFVEVNNFVTCEMAGFKAYLKTLQGSETLILANDRVYPSNHEPSIHVVLYGHLGTKEFSEWHKALVKLSDEGKIVYIFRHFSRSERKKKCFLSGYGVELAIKSTEYKAKDDAKVEGEHAKDEHAGVDDVQGFVFSTLNTLHPSAAKDLQEFRQFLVDSTGDMAPLKVWQMQDLSLQAAQKVMMEKKENRLDLLKDLSQNFPSRARGLMKVTVDEGLRRGIRENQRYLEQNFQLSAGDSAFFINGIRMDSDMFDVFSLMEKVDAESALIEGLAALGSRFGLDSNELSPLLTFELKNEDVQFGLDIRDPSIWYLNDLETDASYMSWPSSVSDLLRPTFPGMLRHIRKNLFNLVLVINPGDDKHLSLVKTVEAFYSYNAPLRIGLMFVVPDDSTNGDASRALVNAFNHIFTEESPGDALSFLAHDVFAMSAKGINADSVRTLLETKFSKATANRMMTGHDNHDNKVDDDDDDDEKYNLKKSMEFYQRSGLTSLPQLLLNGVPLTNQEVQGELEDAIYQRVLKQTSELQKYVYSGHLTDNVKVIDFLMTQKNIMPRLNQQVLQSSSRYLDLALDNPGPSSIFISSNLHSLDETSLTSILSSSMKYLVKNEEANIRPLTLWVTCDLEQPEGRNLFLSALKQLKHTNKMRLGLIHNIPETSIRSKKTKMSAIVQHAIENLSLNVAKNFLFKVLKEENVPKLLEDFQNLSEFAVGNMDVESFIRGLELRTSELFDLHRVFCQKVLKLSSSSLAAVANGKIIGPISATSNLVEKDFELMEKVSSAGFFEKAEKIVKSFKLDGDKSSDLTMRLESLLMSQGNRENRVQLKFVESDNSVLHVEAPEPGPTFNIVAVLDPVSRGAQKFVPIIEVLREVVNADIKIFFNCKEKLSEMPLKSFYRFVLSPEHTLRSAPTAYFEHLPENSLLTLSMDTPESWLVEAVHAPYDLDNILMSEVQSGLVSAEFELEKLLLEGRCYDFITGNPPRGLQFILGTNSTQAQVDTIVMANLGYFQLKASPGLWYLRLREGKSRELYNIIGQGPADVKDNIVVVMDSFKGVTIYPKVTKKEGMEREDLLADTDPSSSFGIWDSLSNTLGGRGTKDSEEDSTINVFSLASGHLYERFLRIMMLSVIKNTQSKVKFWFLKNYLSPSFKNFIPHMAAKYNFEYELVQYKWPRWLHQQTEKQRIIWGYKILFLDVLFPLNVNKIIFVDADQTVRADLKELQDLDLEGAPYGYTPFCDSREDMDGFRFWKSGYWQSHLGHRKYHISALYVVDLKKFRRIAAGDRLRGQYQGLSQDPNSLSNLDQDLPNNMIHQVAIKSLPQEWLWCETWCSDAEKKKAKTIDLCNNPKTKEPKLEAAVRIVGEWKDYDTEIKSLWDQHSYVNNNTSTTVASDLPHSEL